MKCKKIQGNYDHKKIKNQLHYTANQVQCKVYEIFMLRLNIKMFFLHVRQLYKYVRKMNDKDPKLNLCHLRFQLKSDTTRCRQIEFSHLRTTCGWLCVKKPTHNNRQCILKKSHTESSHDCCVFSFCFSFFRQEFETKRLSRRSSSRRVHI